MPRHLAGVSLPRNMTWDQFKAHIDEALAHLGLRGDIEISSIEFSGWTEPDISIVAGQLFVGDE